MRRAYIEAHSPLPESFKLARRWAGPHVSIIAPSTSAIEASEWLPQVSLPLGVTSNRRSRYTARPVGTVIAWCLDLAEILDIEAGHEVDGVVSVRAFDEHRPWVTAHQAEHLGGHELQPTSEASAAIKATVEGITMLPVLNQGLIDSRERSTAVHALTYLRQHGHTLNPSQLVVEAIRNEWPRRSSLELARIATDLNAGKRLRYQPRLSVERLAQWAALA
jgi:hypothetical protein